MPTESIVQLILSIPCASISSTYCSDVLDEMRNLADACKLTLPVSTERWESWPLKQHPLMRAYNDSGNDTNRWYQEIDQCALIRAYTYSGDDMDRWYQEKSAMMNDCACISASLYIPCERKTPREISIFARIHDTRAVKETYPEQEVRMEIPRSCWNAMDKDALIAAVQRACCTLQATYAAIDQAGFCPLGVSGALFMSCSHHAPFEACLPAICWAQWVPFGRIQYHGDKMSFIRNAPNCRSQLIRYHDRDYAWIQLNDDIWKPSMETRLAFRKYFRDSFPALDLSEVAASKKMQFHSLLVDWMPLLAEEQEQVKLLMEKAKN